MATKQQEERAERKRQRRMQLLDGVPRKIRQPDGRRYLIITAEDAAEIYECLHGSSHHSPAIDRLKDRLCPYGGRQHDVGAPIDEIVQALKHQEICAACGIEGVSSSCNSIDAQKQGRRLGRLLEIARGERRPWQQGDSEGVRPAGYSPVAGRMGEVAGDTRDARKSAHRRRCVLQADRWTKGG